jgi:hypothetical protein
MSYLEQLSNIRDSITSQQDELQGKFDTIANNTTEILQDKISQISDKMEMVGGLGFGAMELASKGKQIFQKVDGLINNKSKPPTTEAQQDGTQLDTFKQESTPIENEGGEEMTEMTDVTPAVEDALPASELMPAGAGGAVDLGAATMGNGVLSGGATELPQTATTTVPEDVAVEGGETVADTSVTFGDTSATAAANALSGAAEGSVIAGESGAIAGGEIAGGLAIADTVLAAAPVVGEIALIGTAIVGGLMSLFGINHDSTYDLPSVPSELVSNVGTSLSELAPKQVLGNII